MIYWVVKERIAMARKRSEVVLETVGVTRGESRRRYMAGSPGERRGLRRATHSFIFLGKDEHDHEVHEPESVE